MATVGKLESHYQSITEAVYQWLNFHIQVDSADQNRSVQKLIREATQSQKEDAPPSPEIYDYILECRQLGAPFHYGPPKNWPYIFREEVLSALNGEEKYKEMRRKMAEIARALAKGSSDGQQIPGQLARPNPRNR